MRVFNVSAVLGAVLLFAPGTGFADVGQSVEACVGDGGSQAECAADLAARRAHEAALEAAREAAAEAAWEAAAEAAGAPAAGP